MSAKYQTAQYGYYHLTVESHSAQHQLLELRKDCHIRRNGPAQVIVAQIELFEIREWRKQLDRLRKWGGCETQHTFSRRDRTAQTGCCAMRTFQAAVAKVQLRIIRNICGAYGESEALVSIQIHVATIRLQTAD